MLRFFLFFQFSLVYSLNVLVFSPAAMTSPLTFMSSIADTLTEAGHNVTVLSPIVDENLRSRVNSVKSKDLIIVEPDELMKQQLGRSLDPSDDVKMLWRIIEEASEFEENYKWIFDNVLTVCPNMFRNKEVMDEISARHFDVALSESMTICGLALFKKLGIEKTIIATSFTLLDYETEFFGEPRYTSYVPSTFSLQNDKMDIIERYHNYRTSDILQKIYINFYDKEVQQLSKWGTFDWQELIPAASAYFVNSNPYLDFPRPVLQKTIPIGGISVDIKKIRSQKLSVDWDDILNARKKNLLISFGSVAKSKDMPIEWRDNILNVIRSLPEVTFIWKYESDDVQWAADVKNVKFVKWIPQTALLADKRIDAFVTHCGLGSTNELAHLGKPALMVPIFGDQIRNAYMLAKHNGSIYFDKFRLYDFQLLRDSIHKILYEDSYRKNAERLANILKDQPIPPKDAVVKHVEFIGKYGPFPNMDPYGRKLSKFQLEHMDVFAIMYFSYALVFVTLLVVSRIIYNYLHNLIIVKSKIN